MLNAVNVKDAWDRYATAETDAPIVPKYVPNAEKNAKTALTISFAEAVESVGIALAARGHIVPSAASVKTALSRYVIAETDAPTVPKYVPNAVKCAKTAVTTSFAAAADCVLDASEAKNCFVKNAENV